jgi:glycosyltransferase involved in cell wall biosynthesis
VVHIADHSNSCYARATGAVPTLVTCHDLLPLRLARGEFAALGHGLGRGGRALQRWILKHLAAVPHLACVSHKTAADLQRLAPRPAARLHVIPNGLNYPFTPLPPEEARARLLALPGAAAWLDRPGGYYLHVGGAQWYKNRPGLLRIHAELIRQSAPAAPAAPPALVLVGAPLDPTDQALLVQLGLAPHFYRLQDVPSATLPALYRLAHGLIFPSLEEGFGWPPAEAQACACPVFTSNRAPLTEVGGEAAVYFDPTDAAAAAHAILAAAPRADALRQLGLARALGWAPETMLAAYTSLYRSMVSTPSV